MPGRDGTGPSGLGRGLGLGLNYGCRRGRVLNAETSELMDKEILLAERNFLEARVNAINKHLERTKDSNV
ncbi:MAG: DUF5320 domain-containing protein [Clostridia bacterium]|nr:DUF5320 domain-containing protein [Clostridia bacterium]